MTVSVTLLQCTVFGAKLTIALENRYTTLVWRFLPVAVVPDVRPNILGLSVPRYGSFRPSYFLEARTGQAGPALEGLCTRLFAPAVSSIGSLQAT